MNMEALTSHPKVQAARSVVSDEWTSLAVILGELLNLAKAHPKKAWAILVFHVWIYSLVFQHVSEIRNVLQLIPFVK